MKNAIKTPVHEGFNANPTGRARKLTIQSGSGSDSDKESEYMKSRANLSEEGYLNKRSSSRPQHSSFTIGTSGTVIQGKQEKQRFRCSIYCSILPSPSSKFCSELQYNILRAKYCHHTRKLKSYWYSMYKKYDKLEEEFIFPIYNDKAEGLNLTHLGAKIWLSTLALQFLVDEEELHIDQSSDLHEIKRIEDKFSELVYRCGIIGADGSILISKVTDMMQQSQDLLKEMKKTYFTKTEDINIQWYSDEALSIFEAHNDLQDYTKTKLLQGSSVAERGLLDRILIYSRTINNHHWGQFSHLSKTQRLNFIIDCLESTINSVKQIHEKLIPPLLDQIRNGLRTACRLHSNFYPRLVKMSIILNQMVSKEGNKEFLIKDSALMHKEFKTVEILIGYIQPKGNQLGFQLLEVLGMSKLCFALLKKILNFKSIHYTEDVHRRKSKCKCPCVKKHEETKTEIHVDGVMFNDFKEDDFWKTKYPDILRKIPVILNDTEVCLHKKLTHEELEILKEQERIRAHRAEEVATLLQQKSTGIEDQANTIVMKKAAYEPETYKPSKHIRPLPRYHPGKTKKNAL